MHWDGLCAPTCRSTRPPAPVRRLGPRRCRGPIPPFLVGPSFCGPHPVTGANVSIHPSEVCYLPTVPC